MSLYPRRKGMKTWYYSRLPNPVKIGRYVRKSMKTSNRREAQRREREWQRHLYSAEPFAIIEPEPMFFDNLCVQYLDHGKPGNRPQSKRRDRTSIKNLKRYFGGMRIQDITRQKAEQFMAKRAEECIPNRKNVCPKKINPRTVNIEVICLSSMLNKSVDWGYLRMNPIKGIRKMPVDPRPPMVLSEIEEALLMEYLPHYSKPIVKLVLNTGLRLGEALKLQWLYVHWERRLLIFGKSVKTRIIRRVPINDTALRILHTYKQIAQMRMKNKEYIFVKEDNTPFGNIKKGFKRACRKAGIPDFRFHDLRSTFAVRFLSKPENNIKELKTILGHKDIATTVIYLQYVDTHLVEAVKRMDNDTKMSHDDSTEDVGRGKC